MTEWICMLRAVNVGGNRKMPMERLRAVCVGLGFVNPLTFIQSGNVVFGADVPELREALAARLEDAIEAEFGFRPAVILRSAAEMRAVVARNPFADRSDVLPDRLLVTFLKTDPGEERREAVKEISTAPEELVIDGSELFIHYPGGAGRTKLPAVRIERAHGCVGTSRNWNSVLKLLAMVEGR